MSADAEKQHYTMVGEPSLPELEKLVNAHMKNGWKPLGGPIPDGPYWWQAMVRSE